MRGQYIHYWCYISCHLIYADKQHRSRTGNESEALASNTEQLHLQDMEKILNLPSPPGVPSCHSNNSALQWTQGIKFFKIKFNNVFAHLSEHPI